MPLSLNYFALWCGNHFVAGGMCTHCSFLLSISRALQGQLVFQVKLDQMDQRWDNSFSLLYYLYDFLKSYKQVISYQNPYVFSLISTASVLPLLCLGYFGITWTSRTSRTSWQASKCLPRTGCPRNISSHLNKEQENLGARINLEKLRSRGWSAIEYHVVVV